MKQRYHNPPDSQSCPFSSPHLHCTCTHFRSISPKCLDNFDTEVRHELETTLTSWIGNREDAEDVASISLQKFRKSIRPDVNSWRAWLWTIARHERATLFRRLSREYRLFEKINGNALLISEETPELDQEWLGYEAQSRLSKAIQQLSELDQAIIGYVLLGWSFEEIALAIGSQQGKTLKVKTIRNRFSNAKNRLRELYAITEDT